MARWPLFLLTVTSLVSQVMSFEQGILHRDEGDERLDYFEAYISSMMKRFSENTFRTFKDPLKIKDMEFSGQMGIYGTVHGFWRDMRLTGYKSLEYNASNVDFVKNRMDFSAHFPHYNFEGYVDINTRFLRLIPVYTRAEYNLKLHGLRSESYNGVGSMSIDRVEVDLKPEITGLMVFLGFLVIVYWSVVGSYFAYHNRKRFGRVWRAIKGKLEPLKKVRRSAITERSPSEESVDSLESVAGVRMVKVATFPKSAPPRMRKSFN